MPELTKRERGHLVALLMRDKFLARRLEEMAGRACATRWEEAERSAIAWVVERMRDVDQDGVERASQKADERWAKTTTGRGGEVRETLIAAVCRLLGGCEPGEVVERMNAERHAAGAAIRSAEHRAAEAEERARDAEEDQRAAASWAETVRDERDELCAEIDRLRGELERADEEGRSLVAERDALRAKLEAMATERARLVIAAYAVVEAAEKEVPSDEEIAAMAKEVADG